MNVGYSQDSKIEIEVRDVCGNLSQISMKSMLYVINGNDSTLIQSSSSNPFTFDGLNEGNDYILSFELPDIVTKTYGLRDLNVLMDRIASGDGGKELMAAADFNNNNALSAIDLVTLLWDVAGADLIKTEYVLVPKFNENNISQLNLEGTKYLIKGVPSKGQNLNINIVRKGNVAEADSDQCGKFCIENTDAIVQFYDKNIVENEKVIVPIFINPEKNYFGMDIRFDYKNMTLDTVNIPNSSAFTVDKQNQSIHLVWVKDRLVNQNDTLLTKIAEFEFTSNHGGKISDVLSLSSGYNNALLKSDSCYVTLPAVTLNVAEQSQNCVIEWPKDITIPECNGKYSTGFPIINNACKSYYLITYSDFEAEPCKKYIREWKGFNFINNSTEKYTQVIYIDSNYDHICKRNLAIDFVNDTQIIHAMSLVESPIAGHYYSFSDSEKDSLITLNYIPPYTEEVGVYDITDGQYCISVISKNRMIDTSSLNIKKNIHVAYTNKYIVRAISFFGDDIPLTIIPSTIQLSLDGINYKSVFDFDKSYSGQTILFYLRFNIGGTLFYYGEVYATLEPYSAPPPVRLFAFDDVLTKNEPSTFDVYASDFNQIIGLQFGFRLVDCELVAIASKRLDIQYDYDLQWKFAKLSWNERTSNPTTLDSTTVLFSITVMPTNSNNLSTFMSVDPSVLKPNAFFSSVEIIDTIALEFNFPQRPIINQTENISSTFSVYPNPSFTGSFYLNLPKNEVLSRIELLSSTGELVPIFWKQNTDDQFEINTEYQIPSGLYILNVTTNKSISNQKVLVIR